MVKPEDLLPEDTGGTWHPGELELQRRVGSVEKMADIGRRHVFTEMPDQHRKFYSQLLFILVGTVDGDENPWAGLRFGNPGFITSPDPRRLQIAGVGMRDDPMEIGIKETASVGLLGIELHTRRRNRMNGVINRLADNLIEVIVDQSFGNCLKYIQLRRLTIVQRTPSPLERLIELDQEAHKLIENADAFFVATYVDRTKGRQVDISHRGGRTGFVAIENDGVLTIPDFAGNHYFATLGNILVNGRAGLSFVDFADGTLLQMTGQAELVTNNDTIQAFQGAERFWRFRPERIVRRRHALPMRFAFEQWSPRSLETGSWE